MTETENLDVDSFVNSTLKWFRLRGFPRLLSANIEEPLIFFAAASWGPWALQTGADDITALGSRTCEGWLVTSFRRQLREHLLLLDPRLNFRTVEKEEDALAHRFLDISLIYVDAFFAGRPAGETSSRLLGMVMDAKNELLDLVRPFTKKVSASRDPLERIRWKQLKQLLFGNGTTSRSSSSSSSSSDSGDSTTPPSKRSRSMRRATLRAHRRNAESTSGPTFANFANGNAEAARARSDSVQVTPKTVSEPSAKTALPSRNKAKEKPQGQSKSKKKFIRKAPARPSSRKTRKPSPQKKQGAGGKK